jgi:hypothetical protein
MQAAAGSLTRSTLAACRHEPLSESARRSPWLTPTAPVPPPRFACFVSGSIEAIRHASISRRGSLCSPMHRSGWHGCANAIRPAASAHLSCRLHRADDTLHVAIRVDGRAHGARLPLWLPPTASAALRRLAFRSLLLRVGNVLSRGPAQQWLPFSAEVAAALSSCLAAIAAANGIQSRRQLYLHPCQHFRLLGLIFLRLYEPCVHHVF